MLREGRRRSRGNRGNVTLNFYVSGVDAYRERLVAAGHRCTPTQALFYGASEFYVNDPDGNELEIVEFAASEPGYLPERRNR